MSPMLAGKRAEGLWNIRHPFDWEIGNPGGCYWTGGRHHVSGDRMRVCRGGVKTNRQPAKRGLAYERFVGQNQAVTSSVSRLLGPGINGMRRCLSGLWRLEAQIKGVPVRGKGAVRRAAHGQRGREFDVAAGGQCERDQLTARQPAGLFSAGGSADIGAWRPAGSGQKTPV